MSRHRNGELGAIPLRSGRFYYVDKKWYFACREGRELGPFDNKYQAEATLSQYIRNIDHFPVHDALALATSSPVDDPLN